MTGRPLVLGPFTKGLHNSAGIGEYIDNAALFELVNLEVDIDGSLVNRPPIREFNVDAAYDECRVIGSYYLEDGTYFLIITYKQGTTYGSAMVNVSTGAVVASNNDFTDFAACGVQYYEKYYVYPAPGTSDVGGYFDSTPKWTQAALPGGQASSCVIYNERLFATSGLEATADKSRLYFSAIADPTAFTGTDYIDIEPGNGQALVYVLLLTNNLLLFKEHSTYRLTYSADIEKVAVSNISTSIGTSRPNCAIVYGNNSVYVLHNDNIYEMFNFNFTKINSNLKMDDAGTSGLRSDMSLRSLTLFRDRLFVRFNGRMYIYALLSGQWSEIESNRNFREVFGMNQGKTEVGYATSLDDAKRKTIYTLKEDRVEGVDTDEKFTCRITSKTYDFDSSFDYKVLFWWGATVATTGITKGTVFAIVEIPTTWIMLAKSYSSWSAANNASVAWTSVQDIGYDKTITPDLGARYSRRFYKFPLKMRFRQVYFKLETEALPNSAGDAAVRIYDLTAFVKAKEKVYKSVTN